MFEKHERDLAFLDEISRKSIKELAMERGVSETSLYKWLKRIRIRMAEYQHYLGSIYAKQKRSPRVRKMTTEGSILSENDEDLTI